MPLVTGPNCEMTVTPHATIPVPSYVVKAGLDLGFRVPKSIEMAHILELPNDIFEIIYTYLVRINDKLEYHSCRGNPYPISMPVAARLRRVCRKWADWLYIHHLYHTLSFDSASRAMKFLNQVTRRSNLLPRAKCQHLILDGLWTAALPAQGLEPTLINSTILDTFIELFSDTIVKLNLQFLHFFSLHIRTIRLMGRIENLTGLPSRFRLSTLYDRDGPNLKTLDLTELDPLSLSSNIGSSLMMYRLPKITQLDIDVGWQNLDGIVSLAIALKRTVKVLSIRGFPNEWDGERLLPVFIHLRETLEGLFVTSETILKPIRNFKFPKLRVFTIHQWDGPITSILDRDMFSALRTFSFVDPFANLPKLRRLAFLNAHLDYSPPPVYEKLCGDHRVECVYLNHANIVKIMWILIPPTRFSATTLVVHGRRARAEVNMVNIADLPNDVLELIFAECLKIEWADCLYHRYQYDTLSFKSSLRASDFMTQLARRPERLPLPQCRYLKVHQLWTWAPFHAQYRYDKAEFRNLDDLIDLFSETIVALDIQAVNFFSLPMATIERIGRIPNLRLLRIGTDFTKATRQKGVSLDPAVIPTRLTDSECLVSLRRAAQGLTGFDLTDFRPVCSPRSLGENLGDYQFTRITELKLDVKTNDDLPTDGIVRLATKLPNLTVLTIGGDGDRGELLRPIFESLREQLRELHLTDVRVLKPVLKLSFPQLRILKLRVWFEDLSQYLRAPMFATAPLDTLALHCAPFHKKRYRSLSIPFPALQHLSRLEFHAASGTVPSTYYQTLCEDNGVECVYLPTRDVQDQEESPDLELASDFLARLRI
ncbi:hypothetical protein H4Q26_005737 [Puccinia striiformis f. sp. tritici PST-130]|nr:hypothetical protein H4Q26_005737 [Puccinia striiformis f. sp. tritici PST-130]